MQVFIFEDVAYVSDNYHENGGLCIIARDKAHVEELISGNRYIKLSDADWDNAVIIPIVDTHTIDPTVFVFPDAGCC